VRDINYNNIENNRTTTYIKNQSSQVICQCLVASTIEQCRCNVQDSVHDGFACFRSDRIVQRQEQLLEEFENLLAQCNVLLFGASRSCGSKDGFELLQEELKPFRQWHTLRDWSVSRRHPTPLHHIDEQRSTLTYFAILDNTWCNISMSSWRLHVVGW
jgi:hypothetical protein